MNHQSIWTKPEKERKREIMWKLFGTFMQIGLFTFGGGLAMLSLIEEECVEKRKWITREEMMDLTVIAESTPGPIAINCATYVGFLQAGIGGAIVATVGVVIPSFAVIYVIALFLNNFLEYPLVAHAFKGIAVAVGITILDAAVSLIRGMKKSRQSTGILVSAFAVMMLTDLFAWKLSSVTLMMVAAVFSLVLFQVRKVFEKREMKK